MKELEKPNTMELIVIAKHRHCHHVVKVQDNNIMGSRSDFTGSKTRCHDILFRHDASELSVLDLLMKNFQKDNFGKSMAKLLSEFVIIQLTGSDGKADPIALNAKKNTVITCRPHVIWQWLAILKKCHMDYEDLPELPDFGEHFKRGVAEFNEAVSEEALHVNNKD